MGLLDGLPSLEVISTTFSGTNAQFAAGQISSAEVGSGGILNPNLSGASVSGAAVSLEYGPAYIGSPLVGGLRSEVGSATASDVTVAVAFGRAFASAPRVVLTSAQSGTSAGTFGIGSTETTGFRFYGQSGLVYNWFATGSGR